MKPVLKVCTVAFALLSPVVLFAQKPTLACRPLSDSNTFLQPDEQIVGNQICKIVVTPASSPSQPTQTAKVANDPPAAPAEAVATASPAVTHSTLPAAAGQEASSRVAGGNFVWIDPQNPYASYLEAAALKKHAPVEFTTHEASANYIATVTGFSKKGSATHEVMTGLLFGAPSSGANNSLSLSVSNAATGAVVYSYTCKKTGKDNFQSSSECLAKHWAHSLESGR